MKLLCCYMVMSLCGCSGAVGNVNAADPTERGLGYIAAAIVTATIIHVLLGGPNIKIGGN